MGQAQASDFGWFTNWVNHYSGLGLTFARGLSSEQMLAGLGLAPENLRESTFDEVTADLDRPRIRVGEHDGWGYAVEGFTIRGVQSLGCLSVAGGEALTLEYTMSSDTFRYWVHGEFVNGFDLLLPHIRWGRDEHYFDAIMGQVGYDQPGLPDPRSFGARLVQLAFGITIDRDMLERPLLSAELPH